MAETETPPSLPQPPSPPPSTDQQQQPTTTAEAPPPPPPPPRFDPSRSNVSFTRSETVSLYPGSSIFYLLRLRFCQCIETSILIIDNQQRSFRLFKILVTTASHLNRAAVIDVNSLAFWVRFHSHGAACGLPEVFIPRMHVHCIYMVWQDHTIHS
ncbi:hypothetical protein ACLOJK_021513 [Asimina triloba]